MADSLAIQGQFELMGGGAVSTLAQCPGARFICAPGFDLSAPQPQVDQIVSLILDGERPTGTRAGNRTITLPIVIKSPTRQNLAAAREALLQAINAPEWILTWTREGGLPMSLDCYRANPTVVTYSQPLDKSFISQITISFESAPYGRSDTPVQLTFASPATGSIAPPSPVVLDTYGTVSGAHFSQSTQHIVGPHSAHWAGNNGANGVPNYAATFTATDITGRSALSFWFGLGTSQFYSWNSGSVSFALTLSDASGHTLNIGLAKNCTASNSTGSPNWQLVTATIPASATFDFVHVTGYTFTCSNFSSFFYGTQMTPDVYLDALTANPVTTAVAASTRGAIYNLFGIQGTAHAPLNLQVQQAPVSIAESFTDSTSSGTENFIPEAAVTVLTVEKWAGGAPGGSRTTSGQATGGKGGEYTKNTAFACLPGVAVPYSIGAGGVASSTAPTDGGDTWVGANDSTAAHGAVAPAVNTSAAANTAHGVSTDPVAHAGGSPAAGSTTGGGGGESGGPTSAGNAGSGSAGGTGQADAGDGGAGGAAGVHAGSNGSGPGGGGGGASTTGATTLGGNGAAGQVRFSWTRVLTPFKTLIAHRPSSLAPPALSPFVSVGNGLDTPNGGTEYLIPSLVAGVNAEFGGTYSITAVALSFHNPGNPRNLTITINQYEYAGGPSYPVAVTRNQFTPTTDAVNNIVTVGILTLPDHAIAPDNANAIFTATVTSSDTADRIMDVLFIDTMGQTIAINSTTGYPNYYLDEPTTDVDVGYVLGSAFDRASAISVMAAGQASGGPLTVDPGDQILFLYAAEGAPAAVAFYKPHFWVDRP